MSDKKKEKNTPPMPPMPFPPMAFPKKPEQKVDFEEQWEKFEENLDTFCKQIDEMQTWDGSKLNRAKATKKQWNTFFKQCMEMQDSFADSLPDEFPFFVPVSPKDYIKKNKKFQEMANKQATEQADAFIDFVSQRQKFNKDMVSEGVKNTKAKIDEKKAEAKKAAEKAAEKAEPKKAPAKKADAKKAEAKKEPAKKAEPKKPAEKKEPVDLA